MKNCMYKFAFILFAFLFNNSLSFAQQELAQSIDLTIEVSSVGDISLKATKAVERGITALEGISQIVVLKTKDTSYGPMIVSLGGVKAEGNRFWALYVDEKMSMVGAQEVVLNEDTYILLNLESF
ncbi:MAG TPA: hypothetical protein DCX64_02205 [Gammaproteobacteria bacterium]|nr:DUF4430 domain-containing protein [Gammaproteobacteria bacterium]HAY41061.1 hypothetical protein [Gammaproteobacteria bacterium]